MASWNTILALFNPYTFSHSQGQQQTSKPFGIHVRSDASAQGHLWTAPGCQGIEYVAALVGAAICSAYVCGSHGRWP